MWLVRVDVLILLPHTNLIVALFLSAYFYNLGTEALIL